MAAPRTFARTLMRLRQGTSQQTSLPTTSFRQYSKPSIILHCLLATPQSPRTARICEGPIQSAQSRNLSTTPVRQHGHIEPPKPGEELWVTFIDKDGQEHKVAVSKGDNLLDIAQEHDLEMEGACGGSCACSTCHVIVTDEDFYDKMPEPDDDENDMLDLAFGLTETSRLGCQVHMTKELDGMKVKLPSMTRNLQASDFKS